MNSWIIPMAGFGTRTSKLGSIKPLIKVAARPVLYWNLLGISHLLSDSDEIIFVVRRDHCENFAIKARINQIVKDFLGLERVRFQVVEEVLPGPLCSVESAKKLVSVDANWIIVVNCDQFTCFEMPDDASEALGFCITHIDNGSRSSYCVPKFDSRSQRWFVSKIVEKSPISPIASSGVYGFRGFEVFSNALEHGLAYGPQHSGEFYVSGAMGAIGKVALIPAQYKQDLGSEAGIVRFESLIKLLTYENSGF